MPSEFVVDPADMPGPVVSRPSWVKEAGFSFLGDWVGPLYARRIGWTHVGDTEPGTWHHPEKFIAAASEMGCSCVVLSCNRDLSVSAPQDPLDPIRQTIQLAHDAGLRAGAYLRADYYSPEAGDERERELEQYCQRDQRGLIPTWSPRQTYKKMLCFHHPQVVDFFKERLAHVINELKFDFLHIDGYQFGGFEALDACRCDRCKEDFRAFLHDHYGDRPQEAIERFGHARLDGVEPPIMYPMVSAPDAVNDPAWQEWVRFRCTFAAQIGQMIAQTAYELNPQVAIEINSAVSTQENQCLLLGQDLRSIGRFTDAMWSEDGYWPAMLDDATIVTRVRQMKMAESCGNFFIAYVKGDTQRKMRQALAHMAAFNRGSFGCLGFGGLMTGNYPFREFYETKRDFIQWVRAHQRLYRPTDPFCEVAVWRSQCSLSLSPRKASAAFMQTEQLLIEDRVPFTIVFDDWFEADPPPRAVALPAVEALSRGQADRIKQFVHAGGGVLIGENTGELDLDRRAYRTPLLRDLLADTDQARSDDCMTLARCGNGRVAWVNQLVTPGTPRAPYLPDGTIDLSLDHTNWVVPPEVDRVRAALDWVLGDRRTITVDAPRGVLAEYRRTADALVVHLVNLRGDKVLNVRAEVRLPDDAGDCDVALVSPDPDGNTNVSADRAGPVLTITIEELDVCAVLTIAPFTSAV